MFSSISNAISQWRTSQRPSGGAPGAPATSSASASGEARQARQVRSLSPEASALAPPAGKDAAPKPPLLRGRHCRDLTGQGRSSARERQATMNQFLESVLGRRSLRDQQGAARAVCRSLGGRAMSDQAMSWALEKAATPLAREVAGAAFSEPGGSTSAVITMLHEMIAAKIVPSTGKLKVEDVAGIDMAITATVKDPALQTRCFQILSDEGGWKRPGTGAPAKSRLVSEVEHFLADRPVWPHSARNALESMARMQGSTMTREDLALALRTLGQHHAEAGAFGGPTKQAEAAEATKEVLAVFLEVRMPPGQEPDGTRASATELTALVQGAIHDPQLASECVGMIEARAETLLARSGITPPPDTPPTPPTPPAASEATPLPDPQDPGQAAPSLAPEHAASFDALEPPPPPVDDLPELPKPPEG